MVLCLMYRDVKDIPVRLGHVLNSYLNEAGFIISVKSQNISTRL